jgi:hypothetical protein
MQLAFDFTAQTGMSPVGAPALTDGHPRQAVDENMQCFRRRSWGMAGQGGKVKEGGRHAYEAKKPFSGPRGAGIKQDGAHYVGKKLVEIYLQKKCGLSDMTL